MSRRHFSCSGVPGRGSSRGNIPRDNEQHDVGVLLFIDPDLRKSESCGRLSWIDLTRELHRRDHGNVESFASAFRLVVISVIF